MDPQKRSATIEIIDDVGKVLALGRYGTDKDSYAEMLNAARQFDHRVWAVDGCNGIGRHIAHRLVHDGETVIDVPAKQSAQLRVFATGNGRKTDPWMHIRWLATLHSPNLRRVEADSDLLVLGMLADGRDGLGTARPIPALPPNPHPTPCWRRIRRPRLDPRAADQHRLRQRLNQPCLLGQPHHRHQLGQRHEILIVEHHRLRGEPVRNLHPKCPSELDRSLHRHSDHRSSEGAFHLRYPDRH